jgi:hypothetical protein
MSDKKFIGIVKEHKFQNGGSIIKLGIKAEDLRGLVNERGYINLVIAKKKEPLNDGKDYYCYVDDYKPKEKEQPEQEPPKEQDNDEIKIEDIPF